MHDEQQCAAAVAGESHPFPAARHLKPRNDSVYIYNYIYVFVCI